MQGIFKGVKGILTAIGEATSFNQLKGNASDKCQVPCSSRRIKRTSRWPRQPFFSGKLYTGVVDMFFREQTSRARGYCLLSHSTLFSNSCFCFYAGWCFSSCFLFQDRPLFAEAIGTEGWNFNQSVTGDTFVAPSFKEIVTL